MGEKKGFFSRLVEGLTKTRDNIVSGIDSVFHGFSKIDDEFYEELEEILIMGDLGVKATEAILDDLREKVKANHVKEPAECKQLLIDSIKKQMAVGETAYEFENRKSVVLVIGVNGVGKTTSVGKLAGKLKEQGKKVILAAADTFRAAAGEQLTEWARRAGVEIIGGQSGADPASVVYDAVAAAKPHGRTEKDLPDFGAGVPGGLPGDAGGAGRNYRAERHGAGQTIQGSGQCDRDYSHQTGRDGQGRHRGGDPVGT